MLLTALLCFKCFVVQQLGWRQEEGKCFCLTSSKVSRLEKRRGTESRSMVEHEATRSARSELVWNCAHLNLCPSIADLWMRGAVGRQSIQFL